MYTPHAIAIPMPQIMACKTCGIEYNVQKAGIVLALFRECGACGSSTGLQVVA